MTSTAVGLGIAALGKPEALTDCDCAAEVAGSAAIGIAATRKGIMSFIGYPFDSVWYGPLPNRVRAYSLRCKKNVPFGEANVLAAKIREVLEPGKDKS